MLVHPPRQFPLAFAEVHPSAGTESSEFEPERRRQEAPEAQT